MRPLVEVKRGTSSDEFIIIIKVRETAKAGETAASGPRVAAGEASGAEARAKLKALRVALEEPRPPSLRLDFSAPRISPLPPRLLPVDAVFDSPPRAGIEVACGVPAVSPARLRLEPLRADFLQPQPVRLGLLHGVPELRPPTPAFRPVEARFERAHAIQLGLSYGTPTLTPLPPRAKASAGTAAQHSGEPDLESLAGELEEAYERTPLRLARVVAERPAIVLARRSDFGYIEFLKRVLREVYRVRAGGLPEAKHVSSIRDLELLLPVEVSAGRRVFVLDLASMAPEELRELERLKGRLRDRLRELFSQEFGFFVIYGEVERVGDLWPRAQHGGTLVPASVIPGPVEVSADPGARRLYALLASFMWGRVSDPVLDYERLGFRDLDEFVVWLEDEYWRRLREVSFEVLYRTKPSAGERESELHYLVKAFVVSYLAERVGLDCVETEREEGGAVFDVVVTCGELRVLAVEVETLYGTGTVVHKLVEAARKAGGRRLWIVVPNPQAVIYLPLLLRARRELRRGRDVELYTLDVTRRALVPLAGVARELAGRWKELAKGRQSA